MAKAALREAVREQWGDDALSEALRLGLNVLEDLHRGLNCFYGREQSTEPPKLSSPPGDVLWRRRNFSEWIEKGPAYTENVSVYRDDLEPAVVEYLKVTWWTDPVLELILVDALVYAEVSGFAEHQRMAMATSSFGFLRADNLNRSLAKIGTSRAWRSVWQAIRSFVFKWTIPAAVLIAVGESNMAAGVILATLYGAYLVRQAVFQVNAVGQDQTAVAVKLLGKMISVYDDLGRAPVSPSYMRELMLTTSREGASWPQAAFAVLDRAAKKDTFLWP